jgi:hypothetical protein
MDLSSLRIIQRVHLRLNRCLPRGWSWQHFSGRAPQAEHQAVAEDIRVAEAEHPGVGAAQEAGAERVAQVEAAEPAVGAAEAKARAAAAEVEVRAAEEALRRPAALLPILMGIRFTRSLG